MLYDPGLAILLDIFEEQALQGGSEVSFLNHWCVDHFNILIEISELLDFILCAFDSMTLTQRWLLANITLWPWHQKSKSESSWP